MSASLIDSLARASLAVRTPAPSIVCSSPASVTTYPEWFTDSRNHFETSFSRLIANIRNRTGLAALVPEAVNPGRRIRPALYCALWKAVHHKFPEGSDLLPALALELFHAASIVVDDISDLEETRRNKRPFFRIHDVDTAILISHLLIAEGGSLLASHPKSARLLRTWSDAYVTAAEGQGFSLRHFAGISIEEQYRRSLAKTSSFFTFIAEVLLTCAHAPMPRLTNSLRAVGECFQLSNDVVDLLFLLESRRHDPNRSYPLRPSAIVIQLMETGSVDDSEVFTVLPFDRHHEISIAARALIPDAEGFLRKMFQPVQDSLFQETLLVGHRTILSDFLECATNPSFWLHSHG